MIRTHLVKALYRNLLGPKNGSNELIEQPFSKYHVGVLTSCFHSQKIDDKLITDPLEKGFEPSTPKSHEYVTSVQESDIQWPDTELDLDGSFTLGLSFVVSGVSPKIKICNTWGRYAYSEKVPSNLKVFVRKPNYYLTDWIDVSSFTTRDKTIQLVSNSSGNVVTMHGIELHLRATKSKYEDTWTVQVFLVNRTPFPDKDKDGKPKRQDEIHRIFQPQIRVNIDPESRVEYLGNSIDEDKYSLLFSQRRTKARGFQCGAVWGEVDPESEGGNFGTFTWPDRDSKLIPKDVLDNFTCPDIRTEYLPPYTILQPESSPRRYDAKYLSKQWDEDTIRKYLLPITKKYSQWIDIQKENLKNNHNLSIEQKKHGEKNIYECEISLSEINTGIDFVCDNERARLAFCFMNSVMNEKRMNEKNENLEWLEFQMAFILQSLLGVTGTSKQIQNIVDVLWFPTGGGKTEAYLGITMFAMAFRRLLPKNTCVDKSESFNNDGGVNVISRYTLRLLTVQQFQRALGAIVESDLKRISNWIPDELKSHSINDPELNEKFISGSLWGKTRFSIGLWIGGDSTPTRFAHQKGGNKGKNILNAEGVLLSDRHSLKYPRPYNEPAKGDPAQIQNCPICNNLLAFPQNTTKFTTTTSGITWIVKTKKTISDLQSIPKSNFNRTKQIELKKNPEFEELEKSVDGYNFIRVTMSINIFKSVEDIRNTIDGWWDDIVNPNFVSKGINSLMSTRAAMPGYFFLTRSGDARPYDFTIHCTDKNCKLNKTSWQEGHLQKNPDIPEPFLKQGTMNISNSVPISAFTVDEQVYSRCPTFIIATVDKFANLPWDSRCSSLFGNVDCYHDFFGYGRKIIFKSPLLEKKNNKTVRLIPDQSELHNVDRFLPPSLIIQDELHLIEGPLGSMVGVYEMALDALCQIGDSGPKYIASSATIKEAQTQINTIFRRDINIFPRPGITASDNFFAKTKEDNSCEQDTPGRLYVGICSAKSVFELPIKVCAIIMSEIHKIRENPTLYGIMPADVEKEIDPYWTYVSYFSDLQLMSRFSGFYNDDIERDVKKFSVPRLGNNNLSGIEKFSKGTRLVPIHVDENFDLYGVSVYCQNTIGKISVALYNDYSPKGKLIQNSSPKKCSRGENYFDLNDPILGLKKGDVVWLSIINDNDDTSFRTVVSPHDWYEILKNPLQDELKFSDFVNVTKVISGNSIQTELIGKRRLMEENNMIQLSSETKSEDLPKHLEKLSIPLQVDALLTSPVFGTGIDVERLGLMNIMTQPKTTSGYIQATGRVGRNTPGLVLTWFSARRARDLDHFENFVGYHRKIHSHVEPITANPFSNESLDLSLGPIIVAILRNGKKINGTAISSEWINDPSGPLKILSNKHGNSPEILSIRKFLNSIASNNLIPNFRKNDNFDQITSIQLNNWLSLAEELSSQKKDFIYGERNPTKPVEKDVVLGSPFHEQRGFKAAFRNTRNSLRDTESTAMFYQQLDKISIRPSQFITRYGPGSLLPGDSCSVTCPSVSDMISELNRPVGNFSEVVGGKKELKKIEISDTKMLKMLRRYNQDIDIDDVHIFEMPTNESLNSKAHPVASFDKLYTSKIFPEWATCSRHNGDRILSKIIHHPRNGKLAVKCPGCQIQFGDMYSASFSSVRFVMACKNGHMSDVDWNGSIHKATGCSSSDADEHRVFIWDETGGGDDIGFNCYGVWTGTSRDVFKQTTCNANTVYSQIKRDSALGLINCKKTFVENSEHPEKTCNAFPKISRKSMMSLRSPLILSSLVIQQKKSKLFDKLYRYRTVFVTAKLDLDASETKDWQPGDLAKKLEERQIINGIGDLLLQDIKNTEKEELLRVTTELTTEIKKENSGNTELTESQELDEELINLENGILEGAKQNKGGSISQIKFPVKWTSPNYRFNFEAMPFSDIRVTMVQTGYTREITETLEEKDDDASKNLLQLRKGKIVSKFSRFNDPLNTSRWYLGNQSIGEGIFIHFDPSKTNNDIFSKQKTNTVIWKEFHNKVNVLAEKQLKQKLTEEEIDVIDSAKIKSNPLFVWWHTLAHQIISELSIDSGFATTAIKERIYCKKNENGTYSTGILIFVSAPGSDGTLGGLTSLVDDKILPKIVERSLERLLTCSNDPVCSERSLNHRRHRGAACHACIMAPETSCSYQNKFIDRNLMKEILE
jgi:hypothetical protein